MRLRGVLALAVLLLLSPATPAQAPPDTAEQAADRALAAFRAGDAEVLKTLSAKDDPDPWLVADELCARGEHDAAEAFAGAAPRPDTAGLRAFAAARRGKPVDREARDALLRAGALLRSGDAAGALADLSSLPPPEAGCSAAVALPRLRGLALAALGRHEEAAKALTAAAEEAGRIGWLAEAADAFHRAGQCLYARSKRAEALECWERQVAIEERRENRAALAAALEGIADVYSETGDTAKAIERLVRARALYEGLGDKRGQLRTIGQIGVVHFDRAEFTESLACQELALSLAEGLGDREGAVQALNNLASTRMSLGQFEAAHGLYERCASLCVELRLAAGEVKALGNLGTLHQILGESAESLRYLERAKDIAEKLEDRAAVAMALTNMGNVYTDLNSHEKAVQCHRQALAAFEETGDRMGALRCVIGLGNIRHALGRHEEALADFERARSLAEEIGARHEAMLAIGNAGGVYLRLGNLERALQYRTRALSLAEEMKDQEAVADFAKGVANVLYRKGDFAGCLAANQRALGMAQAMGLRDIELRALWGILDAQMDLDHPREAAAAARQAVELLPLLVGRLAEEEGAGARGAYAGLFDNGMLAALIAGDIAGAVWFLESGRAGSLLEALGARDALAAATLPPPLLAAERDARSRELTALRGMRAATETGRLDAVRAAKAELDAARKGVLDAAERIEREARAAAAVVYPRADTLERIQASLGEGEALVLLSLGLRVGMAVVITRGGVSDLQLGPSEEIEAACASIALGGPAAGEGKVMETLRSLVAAPLTLGAGVKRVFVSPDGALSYLPFCLLLDDREVAYVPSGTTLRLLLAERATRGEGVLAIGDPDYGTGPDPGNPVAVRGSRGLAPIPATADEARAVGTVVLLGRDATEAGLRAALSKRPRWRAVHVACHGLLDAETPMLSSLALTPGGGDDGFLTALEVFRLRVPADLAVLSACETGRGKVIRGEGIVGLVRAFLFAGAPRVICSLWKVDDAATRALMTKFYELWNPREGAGLPAAEALRKAQQFVASQEKWKDPVYWAAWQIWGLAE